MAARRSGADAVVTIFHQCYRELCGLEAAGLVPELIGPERLAKVGMPGK